MFCRETVQNVLTVVKRIVKKLYKDTGNEILTVVSQDLGIDFTNAPKHLKGITRGTLKASTAHWQCVNAFGLACN
jgi:hypothetical protein